MEMIFMVAAHLESLGPKFTKDLQTILTTVGEFTEHL